MLKQIVKDYFWLIILPIIIAGIFILFGFDLSEAIKLGELVPITCGIILLIILQAYQFKDRRKK